MAQAKLARSMSLCLLGTILVAPAFAEKKQENKVRAARWVYEELFGNRQEKLPAALLADTKCIAVFPDLVKAGLVLGGSHGKGVVSCRNENGWSPPSFLKVTEGSIGFQIGYKSSDMVLFFVTDKSARALLDDSTTFGGDLSFAAGPASGATGSTTNSDLSSDVYIYAQSKGLFGGASVQGLRMATSAKSLRNYYGHYVWPGAILFEHEVPQMPPESQEFVDGLNKLPWE